MDENQPVHHEHHEHPVHHDAPKSGMKIDAFKVAVAVLAVLLIVSIVTAGFTKWGFVGAASQDTVTQETLAFVNNALLQGASAAELTSVSESAGLYNMKLMVNGKEIDSYVTKDGKLFFPQAINVEEVSALATTGAGAEPEAPAQPAVKSDKPKVELYVMSFCPYGNKAEETMYPVYKLLKDKVEWNVHYIVSVSGTSVNSLHGQPETDQNIREVCVKENYDMDAFWKFMSYVNNNCGNNGACWKDAAKDAGADASVIETCVTKKGLEYMKAEADASNAAGAQGSPTLLINGQGTSAVYQYGNTAAYQKAICDAFNTPPEACGEVSVAASTTASTAGGSCGT
jgi:glutaredoxin